MNSVYVERRSEQEFMLGLLEAARAGSFKVCLVSGEPGDGKTALVEHFIDSTQTVFSDITCAIGTCQEISIEKSYEPFQDVFSYLTGIRAREIRSRLGSKKEFDMKHKVRIAAETLVTVAPDLVGILVPGISLLSKIAVEATNRTIQRRIEASEDSKISEDQLLEQCQLYFTELCKHNTLILIFDDAQWIDPSSLTLLKHLHETLCDLPILLVLTYRPIEISSDLTTWINRLRQAHGDILLDLRVHRQSEAGISFISEFLQANRCQVSPEFIQAFYERTQAKPLEATELLNFLISSHVLIENTLGIFEENPELADWKHMPTPLTRLDALLESRLSLLEDALVEMLRIASVEGYEFTAQVIAALLQLSEKKVLETLSTCLGQQYGLVVEAGEENVGSAVISRYRFSNVRYQEHLYDNLGNPVKRLMHGEVAEALETLHAEDIGPIAAILARHYEKARNNQKAAKYLIMVGRQQISRHQSMEGLHTLDEGLLLARNSGYIEGIIDALRFKGMEHIDRKNETDAKKALEAFTESTKLARQHQKLDALSYSLRGLGRVRRSQNRISEATYHYMEALDIANQIGKKSLAAACLNNLGVIASKEKRYDDAQSFYEKRLSISKEIGDQTGVLRTLINLGILARRRGNLDEARMQLTEALKMGQGIEDWDRTCGAKTAFANVELFAGRVREASALLLEVFELIVQHGISKRIFAAYESAAFLFAQANYSKLSWKIIECLEQERFEKDDSIRDETNKYLKLQDPETNLREDFADKLPISTDQLQSEIETGLKQIVTDV